MGGWYAWTVISSPETLVGRVVGGSYSEEDWDWCLTIEPEPSYAWLAASATYPAAPGTCNAEGHIEVEVEPFLANNDQPLRSKDAWNRYWGHLIANQTTVTVSGPWVQDLGHTGTVNGRSVAKLEIHPVHTLTAALGVGAIPTSKQIDCFSISESGTTWPNPITRGTHKTPEADRDEVLALQLPLDPSPGTGWAPYAVNVAPGWRNSPAYQLAVQQGPPGVVSLSLPSGRVSDWQGFGYVRLEYGWEPEGCGQLRAEVLDKIARFRLIQIALEGAIRDEERQRIAELSEEQQSVSQESERLEAQRVARGGGSLGGLPGE